MKAARLSLAAGARHCAVSAAGSRLADGAKGAAGEAAAASSAGVAGGVAPAGEEATGVAPVDKSGGGSLAEWAFWHASSLLPPSDRRGIGEPETPGAGHYLHWNIDVAYLCFQLAIGHE